MESEWAAAAEVGKESELLATWATRGLLEIAAVLVPASKVAAAGKAAEAASASAKAAKAAKAANVGKSAKAPGLAEVCTELEAKGRRQPPPYLAPRIPPGEEFIVNGVVAGRVRPGAGKSVIGKHKQSVMDRGYLQTGEAENASYFNMNGWVWQEQEELIRRQFLESKGISFETWKRYNDKAWDGYDTPEAIKFRDEVATEVRNGMWEKFNKPFIEGMAKRRDTVVLNDLPTIDGGTLVQNANGKWSLTGGYDTYYSREINTLLDHGYTPGPDGMTLLPPKLPPTQP
jgi:hypothetical protein